MSKLLRANFTRLWKSKIFWVGILYTFGIGFFASVTPYRESLEIADYHPHFDNYLYTNCMFMSIVAAVFIGLFIGVEYANGTIRNKLVVGHTRSAVYFANLIVSAAALIIMHLVNLVTIVVLGGTLMGNREMPIGFLIKLGLMSVVALIAVCAVFLLMSMLIGSRSSALVAVLILSFLFLISALTIDSRLREPEYYYEYHVTYTDESGETHEENRMPEKNPYYITGTKREVYEFLDDFLPACQMNHIANQHVELMENCVQLPIYSLIITIAATAGGVYFFRRKNLN